ncbi:Uma2 family endonuclease, partial [Desulfobacterales bacterium HSG17]|nr:Uma2 family endonuclease [Desulfobacterales bacterium HSG17]
KGLTGRHMNRTMKTILTNNSNFNDRPGWIPPHIIDDWDDSPYAYQTEDDLMPSGSMHGQILSHMQQTLKHHLKKQDLMLLIDIFVLYRDSQGIKQRFAPDLTLIPFYAETPNEYDIDIEEIPPKVIIEITSAISHQKDLTDNLLFYSKLGVLTYVVIDTTIPYQESCQPEYEEQLDEEDADIAPILNQEYREQFEIHLWQSEQGKFHKELSDSEGFFIIPEMKLGIKAQGQELILKGFSGGEILKSNAQFSLENEQLKMEKRQLEKKLRETRKYRQETEKLILKMVKKLESLGVAPDDCQDQEDIFDIVP